MVRVEGEEIALKIESFFLEKGLEIHPREWTNLFDTLFLLFFHFFPFIASKDNQALDVGILLSGFSNPALIAVMCLLVVGEGMVRTGGLEDIGERIAGFGFHPILTLIFILVCVVLLSAFINNTPATILRQLFKPSYDETRVQTLAKSKEKYTQDSVD